MARSYSRSAANASAGPQASRRASIDAASRCGTSVARAVPPNVPVERMASNGTSPSNSANPRKAGFRPSYARFDGRRYEGRGRTSKLYKPLAAISIPGVLQERVDDSKVERLLSSPRFCSIGCRQRRRPFLDQYLASDVDRYNPLAAPLRGAMVEGLPRPWSPPRVTIRSRRRARPTRSASARPTSTWFTTTRLVLVMGSDR